jgi:quercetin dioxygenase-like cupin family protein
MTEQSTISVIPAISDHYHAMPINYDFDKIPLEILSDKISRQYIMGANSMLVRWFLKKGAVIPLHHHANEQITWITEGAVEVTSQNKTYIVKAGGVLVMPSHVPHAFIALEDTIDIDIFTPVREDWLTGKAEYINQIKQQK